MIAMKLFSIMIDVLKYGMTGAIRPLNWALALHVFEIISKDYS